MKTSENPTINVYNKKVGAGHYQIDVVCEETNETFSYVEKDMTIIDALNDEDNEDEMWEAMQTVINKATEGKY